MSSWTVKLRQNQPDGRVHSYSFESVAGLVAAAEALAHFCSLDQRPLITPDSNLEVALHDSGGPGETYTVAAVLDYLNRQPQLLEGIENKRDLDVLRDLAKELEV